ncbi:MAG TPA: ATP-dependent 6-phosphofructokinase [Chloroflexota bacterium]|nr:ATP-dependent 6-phosphofructokinase [Chloroflexota bacterium]
MSSIDTDRFPGKIRRIGVLTGGGDCPGLNAVVRAVVKSANNLYGWEVVGIEDGFDGLIFPERSHLLTPAEVRGILPRGGTILGTTNRGNPFSYVMRPGSDPVDVSDRVLTNLRELGIDALVVIGGDGTLAIAQDLMKLGVRVVGIPKTIDNDLSGTDVTFGFDTAVATATDAIDRLHTTAESHHRTMILEVMGRNAGWIAIESGIAGGADVILIPEIPFRVDRIVDAIVARQHSGSKFSIIVVAEGAASADGGQMRVGETTGAGARFAGMGNWLGEQLGKRLEQEVRVTVLGHLQRGGSPSPFDRVLATRFGVAAVRLLGDGAIGRMVAYHGSTVDSVPLADALGMLKTVPPDGEHIRTARALGIWFCD